MEQVVCYSADMQLDCILGVEAEEERILVVWEASWEVICSHSAEGCSRKTLAAEMLKDWSDS